MRYWRCLSIVLLAMAMAGPARAASSGWLWRFSAPRQDHNGRDVVIAQGTTPYVYHFANSKIIRPVFVAGHLRRFEVHLDDGHGEPFYDLAVEITGNRASASAIELDQDAWPSKHFSGTFRRDGYENVITLQSAEDERIVLSGNPPAR